MAVFETASSGPAVGAPDLLLEHILSPHTTSALPCRMYRIQSSPSGAQHCYKPSDRPPSCPHNKTAGAPLQVAGVPERFLASK